MFKSIMSGIDNLKTVAADVRDIYNAHEQGNDWSATAIRKYVDNVTDEELQVFSNEISDGIDDFNEKFISVQQADAKGISTVQWMRDTLVQHVDVSNLGKVEQSLAEGNLNILETMKNSDGVYEVSQESLNQVDEQLNKAGYDESSREEIIAGIVRQAEATGAGTALLGERVFPENDDNVSSVENEILDSGTVSELDKDLKAMASTVLKIGACSGKVPFLSSKTPMALITNIACIGVEIARTAKMLFDSKIAATQAIDRMAHATCAATASLLISKVAPKALAFLGPLGAVVGTVLTPILATVNPEPLQKVLHKGLEMIKPLAVPVIEKAVEFARETWNTVKTTVKNIWEDVKAIFV